MHNLAQRVELMHKILRDKGLVHTSERHKIWDAVIEQLQFRLNQFRQLMVNWFTRKQTEEIHEAVITHAYHAGLKPLTTQLADYNQLEDSYTLRGQELILILHVPTTMDGSIWTVYRILLITTNDDVIAVGAKQHYKVMSKADFDKCICRNHYLICEQPLVSSTNLSSTCVGSLVTHNPTGIGAHCDVHLKNAQELVFQTSSNQFAIYLPQTYTATGTCVGRNTLSFLISQNKQITISQGCQVKLSQHVIKVSASVISPLVPWTFDSEWDTLEVSKRILSRIYLQEDNLRRAYDAKNDDLKLNFSHLMTNATADSTSLAHSYNFIRVTLKPSLD